MELDEVFAQGEIDTEDVHPATAALLAYFEYDHLPPFLQKVSMPFCILAERVASSYPGAETTVALRKLLEAKDCAVRAALSYSREPAA